MDLVAVGGLAVAHVLARVANRVAKACVPSMQVLQGFPRWRWVLSVVTQALVFPALMLPAWRGASAGPMAEWLARPASASWAFDRWYIYALLASQTRDMFPMPAAAGTLMKVHHWLVVLTCLLTLCAPAGFGLFVAGSFVLEVGSMACNLRVLYPDARAVEVVYQTTMLLSNLAAVAAGVWGVWTWSLEGIPRWMKLLYFAADVGVCIGRQRHAWRDLRQSLADASRPAAPPRRQGDAFGVTLGGAGAPAPGRAAKAVPADGEVVATAAAKAQPDRASLRSGRCSPPVTLLHFADLAGGAEVHRWGLLRERLPSAVRRSRPSTTAPRHDRAAAPFRRRSSTR